jgi:hypothetical protein
MRGLICGEGIYPRWAAQQPPNYNPVCLDNRVACIGAAAQPSGAVRRFAKSPRHK